MNGLTEKLHRANEMIEGMDEFFILIVTILTYLITAIGILVLSITILKAFAGYWRRMPNDPLQLSMAKGMQLSLQFLLGGEILRTVIAENWDGIMIVGAIIALRIVLAVLIHWESHSLDHSHSTARPERAAQKTS